MSKKIPDHIDNLIILKDKLNHGKMSVLVGAGFSKNTSDLFPSWSELLGDLVLDLFKQEFNSIKKSQRRNKEDLIKAKKDEIFQRHGYLNTVSKFIEAKGFVESICTYIEERIPEVVNKEGGKFLKLGIKEVPLNEESLYLHKTLISLPWNNIYTTNYDQLLEAAVNDHIAKELGELKENALNSIQDLNSKLAEIERQLSEFVVYEEDIIFPLGQKEDGILVESIKEENESSEERLKEKKSLEYDKTEIKQQIEAKSESLFHIEKGLNECFTLVNKASQLSIKRNKNIIKLHGTLRSGEERDTGLYGFDEDIQNHYIISKEDYDSYTSKHEPFSQLIRISLLQESFCLIGFSGDDPNFKAWISWVRDILKKRRKPEHYKVYLIDIGGNIDSGKELFFENHGICRIPVSHPKIIEFLKGKTHTEILNNKDPKALFNLLFNFFHDKYRVDNALSILGTVKREEIKKQWDEVFKYQPYNSQRLKTIAQKLTDLNPYNILPSIHYVETFQKLKFIDSTIDEFNQPIVQKSYQKLEYQAQLMFHAFNDCYVPIIAHGNQEKWKNLIKFIFDNGNLRCRYQISIAKDYALRLKKNPTFDTPNSKDLESIHHFKVLKSAFSLNYKKLENDLKNWDPKGFTIVKKVGLLALFNIDEALTILECFIYSTDNIQEKSVALQLYRYLKRASIKPYDKNLNEVIRKLESDGYKSINENFDYLIEEIKTKDSTKIQPLGKGRNAIAQTTYSKSISEELRALQYIYLLIDSGFPLTVQHTYFRKSEDWFLVLKLGFEVYPYPFIFYSLQLSDDKALRRIAQEYSYSKKLSNKLPLIIKRLLRAYQNSPDRIKGIRDNILTFSSELFITINPIHWQEIFFQIAKDLVKDERAFIEYYYPAINFISEGLTYSDDSDKLTQLLSSLLEKTSIYSDNTLKYTYAFAQNKNFLLKSVSDLKDFYSKFDPIIDTLDENINYIFYLGNLFDVLSLEHKKSINGKLHTVDYHKIRNINTWGVILHFSKLDNRLLKRLKKAILESKYLWATGIEGPTRWRSPYVPLSKFREKRSTLNLRWEHEEVKEVYYKLKVPFEQLFSHYVNKSVDPFIDHTSLVAEMVDFLVSNKPIIKEDKEYNKITTEAKSLLQKLLGYKELISGLISDNERIFGFALNELNEDIQLSTDRDRKLESTVVLNRILFEQGSKPKIEICISMIPYWLKNKAIVEDSGLISLILEILNKFRDKETFDGYHVPFLYENLISIAKKIKELGLKDESIDYWLDKLKKPLFNNLKSI